MCFSSTGCGGNDRFIDEIRNNATEEIKEERKAKKVSDAEQGKVSGFWLSLLRGLNAVINYLKPCKSEQENVSSSPWWRNYKRQRR
jgi:hypothetical protein